MARLAWRQRQDIGPAIFAHAMTYDPVTKRTLMFGGYGTAGYSSETWVWSGRFWTQIGRFGPPARGGHSLNYDTARQRAVVFGGVNAEGGQRQNLNDTWEFDGTDWTQVQDIGPPRREFHAAAYDPLRQRLVLFGGVSRVGDTVTPRGDTWEWDGVAWTQVDETGPPAREKHAMAFDSTSKKVVMYGGFPAEVSRDTWEWDGTTWTKVADTGPGVRLSPALASAGPALFLHGGAGTATVQGDTWQWAGGEWKKVQEMGPSARQYHAMAFDTNQSRLVMFGGFDGTGPLGDTWEAPVA